MNQPTTHQSIAEQLKCRELEVKHLNTVNQELQDELTKAKLRIKELSMNNTYLKGFGDSEPDCKPEPTDEQVIRAVKEHAVAVARNCTDEFPSMVRSALVEYFIFGKTRGLDDLANASAADLLHRSEV